MKKISIIVLMILAFLLCGCNNKNENPYDGYFDLPDNYKYTTINEGVGTNADGSYTDLGCYKYEVCKYGSNFKLTTTETEIETMTEAYATNCASQYGMESASDLMDALESQYLISSEDGVYTLVIPYKSTTNFAKLNENSYLWDEYLVDSIDSTKYHFATKQIYKDRDSQIEVVKKFIEKSNYNDATKRYEFDLTKKNEIEGLEIYDNIEYANIYITNGKLSKFEIKMTMISDDITYTLIQSATFENYYEEISLPTNLIYCEHQYNEQLESITIYDQHFHGYVCIECGNIKDLTECELHDGKCSVCGYDENK